ncbi:hypothetical protein V8G54_003080 [Vigna mungo]|uniref:non-specific serine/threonine protein kinase n=1 Tax=Vigna mungo TaxID=3915 RepID=A0AAQ3P9G2_VIGMU
MNTELHVLLIGLSYLQRISESIEEYVARTPTLSDDGAVTLGSKRSTLFEVDAKTGSIIQVHAMPDPVKPWSDGGQNVTNIPNINNRDVADPVKLNSPQLLLKIFRTDYSLKSVSPSSRIVLWTMSLAEFQAVLLCQHSSSDLEDEYVSDSGLNFTMPYPCQEIRQVFRLKKNFLFEPSLMLPLQPNIDRLFNGDDDNMMLPQPLIKVTTPREVYLNRTIEWPTPLPLILFTIFLLVISLIYTLVIKDQETPKDQNSESELKSSPAKKKKTHKSGRKNDIIDKREDHMSSENEKVLTEKDNDREVWKHFNHVNENVDGRRIGKLFVSNKEIAKGSNGTIVLEGIYEGRAVAIKRLVKAHNDIAFKEVNNLIMSDCHPNIVRWHGVEYDNDFVYLALERCTCNLDDLVQIYSDISVNSTFRKDQGIGCLIKSQMDMWKASTQCLWKENGYPSPLLLKLMRAPDPWESLTVPLNLNRSLHCCATFNLNCNLHCCTTFRPCYKPSLQRYPLCGMAEVETPETGDRPQTAGELQSVHSAYRLNGKNYLKWSQIIKTILKGEGKISHLIGNALVETDPKFKSWDEEDSMIMAWLWNSMVPEISGTCMFLKSAKEIWEAIEQTYSKAKDAAQIYDVKVKTLVIKAKCSEDSAILKDYIEQDRVFDFLVGLNPEYDQVRIQILGKEKVPGLNEVVAIIRSEESKKGLMLETSTTESSTMIAEGGTIMVANQKKNWVPSMEKKHEEIWCTHCNKPRHTREKCWKLHGKPPSREWGLRDGKTSSRECGSRGEDGKTPSREWGPKNPSREWGSRGGPQKRGGQGQAYIANGQGEEAIQLNHEEIERVRSILSKLEKPTGTCSLTYSGKFPLLFGLNVSDTPFTPYWVLDSGATDHMTPLHKYFSTYSPCPNNKKISTADGTLITAAGQGDVQISPSMTLKNVLHVPKLSTNLISIQKLTKDLSCNVFYSNTCILQDKNLGRTIGHAREWNDLYYMEDLNLPNKSLISKSTMTNKEKAQLYHCRLGHPSFQVIKLLFPSLFKNLNVESLHCEVCEFAKHKRVPFPISNKMSPFPFSLVHTDVWGPAYVPNISGAKWFLTSIDDCTRVTWVFLLKQKSEVSSVFVQFVSMIKNQFGVSIKRIRSDNAKDCFNHEGIIHESSCVNTPQQNGVAERKNGHLLDQTRALLFQNHVPKRFWGEALLTATYLINRLPTKILNSRSPMEVLSSFYPHLDPTNKLQSRIFRCVSFVHVHSNERGKLDPRAVKCVFLGNFVSRDVTFNEQESYFKQPHLQGENVREEDETLMFPNMMFEPEIGGTNGIVVPEIEGGIEPAPEPVRPAPDDGGKFGKNLVYSRREKAILEPDNVQESNPPSLHEVTPSNPINPMTLMNLWTKLLTYPLPLERELEHAPNNLFTHYQVSYPLKNSHLPIKLFSLTSTPHTPSSVSEALFDRKWKHAMDVEMEALNKNGTWELVTLPPGKKPVGCKWVYAIKYRADGTIERFKARLVAKGFTQTYGVDYLETFAPVAEMNTIRVILSLAANNDWDLQQFDVKNAFLHGYLEEEIYMELPPGYNGQAVAGTVCKLRKALYGLKQSPRAWFGRFTKVMTGLGYKQSQGDHTLFIKHSVSGGVTILLVYVDDIIVSGDDKKEQQVLSECLATEFEIKTLGRLKYFLGIEVAHSKKGIFISQQKYITDLLKETGKTGCRPASTPVDPNIKLGSMEEDVVVDKEMYQRLVGRLIYLSHTRPDIAFAVSLVSQFMHQPKEAHLQAALRIVQYLKGTLGRGILFKRNKSVSLEAYTDTDYAGSVVDRRSTTGYCTFLGGNLVTWKSKKQSVVARSSAEAEFRAMAHGICELLWLKIILEDLRIKWDEPMRLYCDNKSAISIAHNPVQHDRNKHIEVDRHFIKEKLDSGMICTPYVSIQNQLAVILTKGLNCINFEGIISKLGMENTYSPA